LEEKAKRALSVLLWRRASVRAGHPWGVMVMLMMGRRDIRSAIVDVRFPVVDVWVVVSLFNWWRSRLGRNVAEKGRREMDKAKP
jgi:hypothetical protein